LAHLRDIRAEAARISRRLDGVEENRPGGDCPPAGGLLHDAIAQTFNQAELRLVAAQMALDLEELDGDGLPGLALSLVLWARRRAQLDKLLNILARERPHVQWQSYR
jgi:hypothetical protein